MFTKKCRVLREFCHVHRNREARSNGQIQHCVFVLYVFTSEQKNGRLITMLLFLKLSFCPTGMLQCTMNTKCTSNFALELPEAIVHIQVKSVCRGCEPPCFGQQSGLLLSFSHLSTCEILHTSHYWSMTVSANCIRCFFYMLFTQIIRIIVLVDFGASFLMEQLFGLQSHELFFSLYLSF